MKPKKYPIMNLKFMGDLYDTRDYGSGEEGKRRI
jgi:hypothetical protein